MNNEAILSSLVSIVLDYTNPIDEAKRHLVAPGEGFRRRLRPPVCVELDSVEGELVQIGRVPVLVRRVVECPRVGGLGQNWNVAFDALLPTLINVLCGSNDK